VSLFHKTELGVKYIPHSDDADKGPDTAHSSSALDWEEKERNFQVSGTVNIKQHSFKTSLDVSFSRQ
jgi:hypothetical protein